MTAEDMIECVAAAIAMKSEGWTKNAKDYIPHARAAIGAMRNGSIDVSELVERLNVPWPEHEVEEVTLPAWILELCAEAATTLTALAAKVSEMEAENEWLWGRVDELAADDEPAEYAKETTMSKLVEQLRGVDHGSVEDCFLQSPLFEKAANRITELEAENERLRDRLAEALMTFRN